VDIAKKEVKLEVKKRKKKREQKNVLLNKDHVVPTRLTENWQMEQSFRKIATAGIVKLFNAVREHQKKIDGENDKKKRP